MKKLQRISQILFTVVYNSSLAGFLHAGVYQGRFKIVPCAGFNCHSCPSAVTTCPIGAFQLFASFGTYHLSLYVIGFLGIIGSVGGRIACGWVCPFGLLQDMLYKIPFKKVSMPRAFEYAKYAVLAVAVIGTAWITQEPWFCKFFCPAGTLEAGIPLMILNEDLRQLFGSLFGIKLFFLVLFLLLMMSIKRPFCRAVCPLGAFYALFNLVSILQICVDSEKCIKCDACHEVCPVALRIYDAGGQSAHCIRCLRCIEKCPVSAITIRAGRSR